MGERELLRTKNAARATLYLVLGIAIGCGRSLKDDNDHGGSSGTSSGGSAGELGGSSGSAGSGGSSARGGSSQSGGSSAQGGSPEGGAPQGGSAGGGGEGGDVALPTRVFLQAGDALVAIDPETEETIELCPDAGTSVRFEFLDWVNERAIVSRQFITPSSTEILRVALDGSECMPLLQGDPPVTAYPPAAGERIVLAAFPTARSDLGPPNGDDPARVVLALGLVGLSLDGSLDVIVPDGIFEAPRIVGDRVLFQRVLENSTLELVSALSDGSSSITPIPVEGAKQIAAIRGQRVIVNAGAMGDVYAVDADGGNLVALATAPEPEAGAGFAGNHVIVTRYVGSSDVQQTDLLLVDENGGELTPLASSLDSETFRGSTGERIIYERLTDLYSVRFDGSDTQLIADTPDAVDYVLESRGERIVYGNLRESNLWSYSNLAADGSDAIPLHDDASGFAAVAGERVILYVGPLENYDLVSVPLSGGEPFLLSDGTQPDWLAGRIGTMLVIQRGDQYNPGEVLRIDADGSRGALLAPSARFLGSVSEACGVHRAGFPHPPCEE